MSRRWPVVLGTALLLAGASGARAQAPGIVLWLDSGGDDERAIERALRLELGSHGVLLLTTADPVPGAAPPDDAVVAHGALARTTADAVLWLRVEPQRQVTWLRVLRRGEAQAQQAPLAHGAAPIDAQLLAVAAASLLDQVLSAPAARAPGAITPQAAAEAAPPQPPSQPLAAQPRRLGPPAGPAPQVDQLDPTPPSLRGLRRAEHGAVTAADGMPSQRWFVQLGASLAFGSLNAGMEADRPPPDDQVFTDDGLFVADSGWVPDNDSVDELGPPVGGCEADGTETGPGEMPSRWCARVFEPGIAVMPAMRFAVGHFILPEFALVALYQWHMGIRTDSLLDSHMFGVQGEALVLGSHTAPAAMLSVLAGATVGRMDTPVPGAGLPENSTGPDARSGPLGLHVGVRPRGRFPNGIGLFMAPTVGGRFPDWQFTMELEMGVELWF